MALPLSFLVPGVGIMRILSFQDVGFSKEYEELRADNCLDEYTAQDSQNPENRDKNRYPNIVACESYITNDPFLKTPPAFAVNVTCPLIIDRNAFTQPRANCCVPRGVL